MKGQFSICLLFLLLATSNFLVYGDNDDKKEEDSKPTEDKKAEEKTEDKVVETSVDDGIERENGVLVLTSKNFDDVVNSKEIILVEFYAPWCGHCKALQPKFEAAAVRLIENHPPVFLAKVDATVETDLGQKFEIQGYPTMKWFKKGTPYDYDGPRDEEGIFQYMTERSSPDWKPPPDTVISLTSKNFNEFIHKEELTLVEFYAPWCGHCKSLAPEYEKASQELKKHDPPIKIAKVDATVESALAQQYGVTGYPTLKLFRRGKESEYKGGRTKDDIVDFMKKQIGDPSTLKSPLKVLKDAMLEDDVTVVGFFSGKEDKTYETYQAACSGLRDDYEFFHSFDKSARDFYGVPEGSVVVFNSPRFYSKHEPKWHVLKKLESSSEMEQFLEKHSTPLVGHYTWKTKEKRYKSKRPLVIAFYTVDFSYDHRQATQNWRLKMAGIADQYRSKYNFVIADEEEMQALFTQFGFDDSAGDINVGIIDSEEKKYSMEPMEEFNVETIKEFIDAYDVGDVKPKVKSQPIPKKQGLVKTIVAKNFENIVLNGKKDVLVEFFAPWCGHCKKLEPVYKNLAKKYKKEKNLVIAKMDATENDVPKGYSVEGYPTIYFATRHQKKNPVKYDGGHELKDLVKFIEEHNTVLPPSKKDEL